MGLTSDPNIEHMIQVQERGGLTSDQNIEHMIQGQEREGESNKREGLVGLKDEIMGVTN